MEPTLGSSWYKKKALETALEPLPLKETMASILRGLRLTLMFHYFSQRITIFCLESSNKLVRSIEKQVELLFLYKNPKNS